MQDKNERLQLLCQGMEEITVGLRHHDTPVLRESDVEELISRAEDVIILLGDFECKAE